MKVYELKTVPHRNQMLRLFLYGKMRATIFGNAHYLTNEDNIQSSISHLRKISNPFALFTQPQFSPIQLFCPPSTCANNGKISIGSIWLFLMHSYSIRILYLHSNAGTQTHFQSNLWVYTAWPVLYQKFY